VNWPIIRLWAGIVERTSNTKNTLRFRRVWQRASLDLLQCINAEKANQVWECLNCGAEISAKPLARIHGFSFCRDAQQRTGSTTAPTSSVGACLKRELKREKASKCAAVKVNHNTGMRLSPFTLTTPLAGCWTPSAQLLVRLLQLQKRLP
jgi:hypothetical protein